MTVISATNVVISQVVAGLTADHPIIGWQNLTTIGNLAATSSDTDFPVSNLANPATHLKWKAGAPNSPPSYQYVTCTTGTLDDIDYVAIARHNLGSAAIPVSIGYFDTSSPPNWVELIADALLDTSDAPTIFRFSPQGLSSVSIRLTEGATIPEIAVMYVGKLLYLPRKLYQGMASINHARVAKITNGRSEAGHFLGRIVLQEFVKNSIPLSLIDPTYFRDYIQSFLVDSKERPFFIAWRPETYPTEVGYCHMTNDPLPVNEAPHGLMAMQLEMTGII